jgi:hypothetical protein
LSNHQAIAAVTATLRSLLNRGLGVNDVTVRPPDRVSTTNGSSHLNLFLYQTSQNAALRNMNIPPQAKPGETGTPPLSLNLYYLITAYGADDANEDITSHQLLGRAMNVLHDHPLLGSQEIKDASSSVTGSDLHNQIERIRITPQPMTLEEMSKLWATFQTNYRISAAYEVAVVLIESTRAAKTPLPVLKRGKEDQGADAQGGLTLVPMLESIKLPVGQLSAKLGDELTIEGFNLSGTNLKVLILPPYKTEEKDEIQLTISGQSTDEEIKAKLPTDPTIFPAGYYKLRVKVHKGEEVFDRSTNTLLFAVAPKVIDPPLPFDANFDVDGNVTFTITPEPQVLLQQHAALLLGELEVVAKPRAAKADPLVFFIKNPLAGKYLVRLRVDGVDSLLVDTTKTPPVFDQNQVVNIP